MNPLHTHGESPKRADQRAVRSFNLAAVARQISEYGSRSRPQIAAATGLNKTTVSSLVGELIARGVVRETGLDADGSVGRPAQVLELNGERIAALGLEVNVDYMAVSACDLRGRVRHRAVVGHDNRESPPQVVIRELARLAREAIDACEELGLTIVGAGVCVPGLVDSRTGMLAYAPNLHWRGFALADRMHAALDDPPFPIRVDNDGNLAALGELESGALRGIRHGVMLYGGIGVGGAVIIDGALFHGAEGFAGEIGHIPIRPGDGEPCSCGARGCLETLVGQEAIARMVGIRARAARPRRRPSCSLRGCGPAIAPRCRRWTRWRACSASASPPPSTSSTRSAWCSAVRSRRSRNGSCPALPRRSPIAFRTPRRRSS